MPTVYIILVNWNGWRDTIECLESVFRLNYQGFRVIVCDNASDDSSMERIACWANGRVEADCSNPELRGLSIPPCIKPLPYLYLKSGESLCPDAGAAKLILVQINANLGFAGANNVGLQLALADHEFKYAWLLNNDTVVEPEALSALMERMLQETDAGICGSTLLYYDNPTTVQALGGSKYNPWTGRGGHIGLGCSWHGYANRISVERLMKYVVGASMFVSRRFVESVGLMNPAHFLYFEEVDWAVRADRRFSLAYAPGSVVYHKEGRSIGSSSNHEKRSLKSEYFSARSCMLFSKRHFPAAIPSVTLSLLGRSIVRFTTGNVAGAKAILWGIRDSLRNEPDRANSESPTIA